MNSSFVKSLPSYSSDAAEQVSTLTLALVAILSAFPEEKSSYRVKMLLTAGNLPISARKKPVQTRSLVSI